MKRITIGVIVAFVIFFSNMSWADEITHDLSAQIEIGFITLDPENPLLGDIVKVKVPIKLIYATQPKQVYVVASIDDNYVASFTLDFYYIDQEIPIQFVFNTEDYGLGHHEIKIDAVVDATVQTRARSFFIRGVEPSKQHCLSIMDIQPLTPPKAGEDMVIAVDIKNCGDFDEANIKTKMEGFDETIYDGTFFLISGETGKAIFTVPVPEGEGVETLTFTVWNTYALATRKYELIILTSKPFIELKDKYEVSAGRTTEIKFKITNIGETEDTFEINVTGEASSWIELAPETLVIKPHESKEITTYVRVPEDVEEGYYSFTITTKRPEYSATSVLHVTKPWVWPTLLMFRPFIVIWIGIILVILVSFLVIVGCSTPRRKEETFRSIFR
jgi:hypothetical protein